MLFLADLTQATIESARVRPEQELVGVHEGKPVPVKNNLGFTAIRPAGLKAYPAIWIQDFTMAYSSGFVSVDEGLAHLRLIASRQNSKERRLPSGAIIPAHAIPDHINLDGSPVFYPGTYSSGPDQGGEPWGVCPPLNNYFDFIWLAYLLWKDADDATFFRKIIKGQTLLERLTSAYDAPPADPKTGIVFTTAERRAVGFIFIDQIYMTGQMLMASLERHRAARQLAEIHVALGKMESARRYARDGELIRANVERVFASEQTDCGWLRAATGVSGQADVWGTLYALHLDVLVAARAKAGDRPSAARPGQWTDSLRRRFAACAAQSRRLADHGLGKDNRPPQPISKRRVLAHAHRLADRHSGPRASMSGGGRVRRVHRAIAEGGFSSRRTVRRALGVPWLGRQGRAKPGFRSLRGVALRRPV